MKPEQFFLKLKATDEIKSLKELKTKKNYKNYCSLLKELIKEQRVYCQECEIRRAEQIHYKDKNHKNNQLDNLVVLCPDCHKFLFHYGVLKKETYIKKVFMATLKPNKIIIENFRDPIMNDFINFIGNDKFKEKIFKLLDKKGKRKANP